MNQKNLPRGMVLAAVLLSLVWLGGSLASDQATTGTTLGGLAGIVGCAVFVIVTYMYVRRDGGSS